MYTDMLLENQNMFKIPDLTTGQMIDQLRPGEIATYRFSLLSPCIIVEKDRAGNIVIVENGYEQNSIGLTLQVSSEVLKYVWTIYRPYVSFYEAMKAHQEQKKTITYHHCDSLTYTFVNELETGQFKSLSNDSICLYELIEGKWTIDN